MGKLNVSIPDELEARLRAHIARVYGGGKGAISLVISAAVMKFLDAEEGIVRG